MSLCYLSQNNNNNKFCKALPAAPTPAPVSGPKHQCERAEEGRGRQPELGRGFRRRGQPAPPQPA